MSAGRIELGLGAGWYEKEHVAYGIPFPPWAERFERLEEQLADSPALPKPVQQPHPPLIVGGAGAKRTPALAATFADEFNMPFRGLAEAEAQFSRVRAACERVGRDPGALRLSVAQVICCGADEAA
jgi:alkanesulfonate monooxygenase SsuD/methylene tetrahydromethanopterin reductase-like flavin-dependent oxidoreductase (luciferase family)